MTTITLEDYEKLREMNEYAFGNLLDIRTKKPLFTDKKNNKDYYLIDGLTEHLYFVYLKKNGIKNPNEIIIKLTIMENIEGLPGLNGTGKFYIKTSNTSFIYEIQKYKCPVRAFFYMDKAIEENDDLEEVFPDNSEIIDLEINLAKNFNRELVEPDFHEYIKKTANLDQYGNEIRDMSRIPDEELKKRQYLEFLNSENEKNGGLYDNLEIMHKEELAMEFEKEIVIKLTLVGNVEDLPFLNGWGSFYIKTNNNSFILEIQKYKCPIRAFFYMDKVIEDNDDINEIYSDECENIDLDINLSINYLSELIEPSMKEYIKLTPYLDEYGNREEVTLFDPSEYQFNAFWQSSNPREIKITAIIRNYLSTMNPIDIHLICKKFNKTRVKLELIYMFQEDYERGFINIKGKDYPLEGRYKDDLVFKEIMEIVESFKDEQ